MNRLLCYKFEFKIIAVLLWLMIAQSAISNENTIWKEMSNKDGIVIYEGDITKDGYVPLKGEIEINAPIEKVAAVLDDSMGKKTWLPAVKTIKVLIEPNEYEKTEFYHVKMPFIVSDRTFILRSKAQVNKNLSEIFVRVESVSDKLMNIESTVRGQVKESYVHLKKTKENKTVVEGLFYTSPKGFIPNWVVTRFTRSFCRESLLKLRKKIEQNQISDEVLKKYLRLMIQYKNTVSIINN